MSETACFQWIDYLIVHCDIHFTVFKAFQGSCFFVSLAPALI